MPTSRIKRQNQTIRNAQVSCPDCNSLHHYTHYGIENAAEEESSRCGQEDLKMSGAGADAEEKSIVRAGQTALLVKTPQAPDFFSFFFFFRTTVWLRKAL